MCDRFRIADVLPDHLPGNGDDDDSGGDVLNA